MGKYDAVLGSLTPAPIVDLKYQEKVSAAKSDFMLDPTTGELVKLTPDQMGELFRQLRAEDAEIDARRYLLQVKITALEQMLAESWTNDEDGWGTYGASPNSLRMKSGFAVDIEPIPEGKVEDPEAFRLWCEAPDDRCMTCGNGFDEHVTDHDFKPGGGLRRKLQLWPSTMNAIAKERCLAGAPQPDGVAVYLRTKVKLRKM